MEISIEQLQELLDEQKRLVLENVRHKSFIKDEVKQLSDELVKLIEEESAKHSIFEPKYGGKDHSGYETLMKYEVNSYLEEYFEKGATWMALHQQQYIKQLEAHLSDLNNALNVLRTNNYDETSIGYAEHIHKAYHKALSNQQTK